MCIAGVLQVMMHRTQEMSKKTTQVPAKPIFDALRSANAEPDLVQDAVESIKDIVSESVRPEMAGRFAVVDEKIDRL